MAEARRTTDASGTASEILDVAERLVQTRGFNGFSYADVASELSVTKASLHYHFPSKAELGGALIGRYTERFQASLVDIGSSGSAPRVKLRAYADLFSEVLEQHRMCLCGMLAAEYSTLPDPMRAAVGRFFDMNEEWLEEVLTDGRRGGALGFAGAPRKTARLIISSLEGAMLVARAKGDFAWFREAAERVIASLTPAEQAMPRPGRAGG